MSRKTVYCCQKKLRTKLSEDATIVTEFSDVQFNLGISDFFFKAISL